MAQRWIVACAVLGLTHCSGTGIVGQGSEAEQSEDPRADYVDRGAWQNPGVAPDCVVPATYANALVVGGELDFDPIETWTGYFGVEGLSPGQGTFTVYVKSRSASSVDAAIVFDQEPEIHYGSMVEPVGSPPAGYAFSLFDSSIDGDRWDFTVRLGEWLREWCESKASFELSEGAWPDYSCTPSTAMMCTTPAGEAIPTDCVMYVDAEQASYQIDGEELARCTYVCSCNSCGCTADATEQFMAFSMVRSGNEMHGVSDPSDTSATIHMALVE